MRNQNHPIPEQPTVRPPHNSSAVRIIKALVVFVLVFSFVMATGIFIVRNHKTQSREDLFCSTCETEHSEEISAAHAAVPEAAESISATAPESTVAVSPALMLSDKVLYYFKDEQFWAQFIENEIYRHNPYTGDPYMEGFDQKSLYYTISDFDEDGNSTLILMSREKDKPMCHIWVWENMGNHKPFLALEELCSNYIGYNPNLNTLVLTVDGDYGDENSYHSYYKLDKGAYHCICKTQYSMCDQNLMPAAYKIQNKKREKMDIEEYLNTYNIIFDIPDWVPLLPDPVVPDRKAEDLSYLLGKPISQFKEKFPKLTALGSYPVSFTNYEVMATPDDEERIMDISLSSMGIPYSILGIQCGMPADTAAALAEAYGAVPQMGEAGTVNTYKLPEDNILLNIFYKDGPEGPYVDHIMLTVDLWSNY